MKKVLAQLRTLRTALLRPGVAPAAVALVVVVLAGCFADYQNRQIQGQRQRNEVLSQISIIRAKLEGHINGNIQLVRGLVATLATEPAMDQNRFAQLAENILHAGPELTHIAAAPNLVVSLIYPLKGNEKAIGLDYGVNPRQRTAALRARDTGELVLAGPVRLVQGGDAFIARFPVFVGKDDARRFWGLVSAVVDVDQLYRDSGLLDTDLAIDVAITGRDAEGAGGAVFYGDGALFRKQPVTADVLLPFGSWRIAAVPKRGWGGNVGAIWLGRLLIFLAGALIVVPILITGRLVEDRQRYIQALHARSSELARMSRRLELALETSRVGVWELNLSSGRLRWDARMRELYGLPDDDAEVTYDIWSTALHEEDAERARADFARAIEVTGRYNSDFRIVLPNGDIRHLRANGTVLDEPEGGRRIVGLNWDVSADVRLNEQLKRANALTEARNLELETTRSGIEHASLHDSLTGLPNRRYLDRVLEDYAEADARSGRIALLHVDLDRFKQINDTLGHAAGDAMLVHAAAVLKANVGDDNFVARVGGDEFVILCRLKPRERNAERQMAEMADRIIVAMRRPVPYEAHECRFGVSVGIAIEPDRGLDPRRLLINADLALYRAKGRGRNRSQFFTDTLQAEILSVKKTADEILNGLERGEFVAYYQPQFSAVTHDIVGVEALVRWNHPLRGMLRPAAFLDIAEELNVVPQIDRLILERSLADLQRWRDAGVDVGRISVNVSARRLHDEELIASLSRLPIEPGRISFELVESIFLDERDELLTWNVDRIKELGIDIEIDDFGTGYASIVSLQKLKPKRLKIDRQLVMPIVRSQAQRQLVRSIIEIGRSLDIEVIAEGVETHRHTQVLASLGCQVLQGYAFAKPITADEIVAFVKASAWRKAS